MRMLKKMAAVAALLAPLAMAACGSEPEPRPKYGEQFINNMIHQLQHVDFNTRYRAAHALGIKKKDATSAIPALQCALYDEHPLVRAEVAWALEQIDPDSLLLASTGTNRVGP